MKQPAPYDISMGKFCMVPKGITVDCQSRIHNDGSVVLTVSVPFILGSETLYFDSKGQAIAEGWTL